MRLSKKDDPRLVERVFDNYGYVSCIWYKSKFDYYKFKYNWVDLLGYQRGINSVLGIVDNCYPELDLSSSESLKIDLGGGLSTIDRSCSPYPRYTDLRLNHTRIGELRGASHLNSASVILKGSEGHTKVLDYLDWLGEGLQIIIEKDKAERLKQLKEESVEELNEVKLSLEGFKPPVEI